MKPQTFKPKTVQLVLTITILFLTACGCTKNNPRDQLPPITQTGANTFGCIINGEVLVPKDAKESFSPGTRFRKGIEAGSLPDNKNTLVIDAGNHRDSGGDYIYIYIYKYTEVGTYNIGVSSGEWYYEFKPDYSHVFCHIYDGVNIGKRYLSNAGTISITYFDPVNNIVSGTFELTAFNKDNPEDIIEITDGRFDINIRTLNQ